MVSTLTHPFGVAAPAWPGRSNDHTVTSHFPKWDHIERFVAQEPELFQSFTNMYPRGIPQKQVVQLRDEILKRVGTEGQACMLFTHPTSVAALVDWASSPERKDNMVPREAFTIRAFSLGPQRLWVAFVPADANMKIQGFWMHPGVGISTRQAQEAFSHIDVLEEIQVDSEVLAIPLEAETIYAALRERIIGIVNRAPLSTSNRPTSSDVYLFPTGMASIYRLHQLLLRTSPGPTVVFGFTFHSTQHLFEDFHPPDAPFLNLGNADAADLATLRTYLADLASQGKTIQALWTEFPSNPNCVTPDIAALRALADQYGFPLIIDDTVASPANVDVMPYADITITSLTKSFSGYSDVMGGSLILNPSSRLYNHFHTLLATHYHNGLHHADAAVLLANSADFLSRSAIHNRNTAALAGLLATSPLITEVYHPLHLPDSRPHYEASMRPPTEDFTPGYGLLLSVEFVSLTALTAFYDALDIYKSPHLGGHVTLALPYIYGIFGMMGPAELDKVGRWGYRKTQLRVAPGLEDTEELLGVFRVALEAGERAAAVEEQGERGKEE